jgi:hypothetical protein
MKPRLRILLAAVAMLPIGLAAHAAVPTLDGKTFTGAMMEQGQQKPIHDTFVFQNGKFESTACDRYGFGSAAYTSKPDGSFEVTTTSPTEGTMRWQGRVTGDRIDGTAVWLKPGKAPVRYTIQGTLKK